MKKQEFSDEELVYKIKMGEEEAFNILYKRYVKLAYFIAYRLCNNVADCDDIVQDSFVQVKDKIQDLQNPKLFKYWLNRIVLSKSKNMFRKNKYLTYEDEHYEAQHNLIETRKDVLPEHVMKCQSDREVMDALINELPLGQKEVVVLHYLEQFSVEETAEILQLAEGTVKSRLSYARTTLKNKVELYERKNNCKLNFESFDALIVATLSYSISHVILPKTMILSKVKMHIIEPTIVSGLIAKVVLVSAIGASTVGGGYLLHYTRQANTQEQEVLVKQIETENSNFPAMILRNQEIRTARIAYYAIKNWAHCEEEMNAFTSEQLEDVYALYKIMKEDNSIYYQTLEEDGWGFALEQAMLK